MAASSFLKLYADTLVLGRSSSLFPEIVNPNPDAAKRIAELVASGISQK